MNYGKLGLFVGGVLFGTAGVAVLSSKDAKKVYTHCTAAVLRGKDSVMKTAATVKENCGDIYADAKDINEKRYEEQEKADVEKAKAVVEQYESKSKDNFSEVAE
ncbi:MAG: DUF6110 family protein [Lachnospiraceae bacterium]|nr:DUF6110 family protein [Lachnospiraceae bacterium]